MPSLSPLSGGSETLTPLAPLVDYPSVFTPGLLPASSLFPDSGPPYPRDHVTTPAIEGLALSPVAETTSLALTPLLEA